MNSKQNGAMRETVREIYNHIKGHFYYNRPDFEVKGESFNSTMLMSLLTGLCQGKELIIGEPQEIGCFILFEM